MTKAKLMNTRVAAEWMHCTENWLHKLVYTGRLKAYMYDPHGNLVEREAHAKRQGQGLYFYEKDLKTYQSKKREKGRPAGSKDKKPRDLKTDENTSISS